MELANARTRRIRGFGQHTSPPASTDARRPCLRPPDHRRANPAARSLPLPPPSLGHGGVAPPSPSPPPPPSAAPPPQLSRRPSNPARDGAAPPGRSVAADGRHPPPDSFYARNARWARHNPKPKPPKTLAPNLHGGVQRGPARGAAGAPRAKGVQAEASRLRARTLSFRKSFSFPALKG